MSNENELGIRTTAVKNRDINKYMITNLLATVFLFAVFAIVNYVIVDNLISSKIDKINVSQEELDDNGTDSDELQKGIIVDLGDFILNLCDEAQKKYLKVNVAIEVTQKDTDFPKIDASAKNSGIDSQLMEKSVSAIQTEMNQFKPAIRDAVITNLSSKTSSELASTAGKELAKEQIANDINSILGGEREVLRVSFGQFIIQ